VETYTARNRGGGRMEVASYESPLNKEGGGIDHTSHRKLYSPNQSILNLLLRVIQHTKLSYKTKKIITLIVNNFLMDNKRRLKLGRWSGSHFTWKVVTLESKGEMKIIFCFFQQESILK